MMGQYLMDIKSGKSIPRDFLNVELLSASHRAEPTINNILRNMKNQFEYSFHQQMQSQQQQNDQVLDLSKRRDSTETRKTTSPSSFEEGSPDMRKSPQLHHQLLLHSALNIPKPPFTPEHSIQYYNYDQTSPTSTKNIILKRQELFERFECKQENQTKQKIAASPKFYHSAPENHHHEDSNDLPPASNISSSSSTASSQKSPSSTVSSTPPMIMGRDGKLSRPFKAYPRDPLSLAAAGSFLDNASAEKYSVFRKRMLDQIHAANGGNPVVNNPKMRRMNSKGTPQETNNNISLENSYDSSSEKSESMKRENGEKDDAYFERRRKNNAAAKKSRDRRRIKEDEIAIRAAFLERENIELKFELAGVRKQLSMYQQGIATAN